MNNHTCYHLLIIPSWYPNSYNPLSGIFFKEQAEGLARFGMQVGVISLVEIGIRNILEERKLEIKSSYKNENGVNVYQLQYPIVRKLGFFRRNLRLKLFKRFFEKYIKEYGMPDLIHLHSFEYGNLALYIKENYNIPYVVTEHSSGFFRKVYDKKTLKFAYKIFRNSSLNIAVSNSLKEYLEKLFGLDFIYLPNMVNLKGFDQVSQNKQKNFRFINVAFLNKNKNQSMLIRAFCKAFKMEKNVKLIIVGDGPEYKNLKNLIEKLGLQKQVELYGRASREEVRNLLCQSQAFVLSSKYETFGVALIEALACGLPVVSTKCGGPESIILNNRIGYLAEVNESDLAEKMKLLYKNFNRFSSSYIRNYVKENFSEEVIIEKLVDAYKKILL